MEHASTKVQVSHSQKNKLFNQRVKYWMEAKGLCERDAIARAHLKDQLQHLSLVEAEKSSALNSHSVKENVGRKSKQVNPVTADSLALEESAEISAQEKSAKIVSAEHTVTNKQKSSHFRTASDSPHYIRSDACKCRGQKLPAKDVTSGFEEPSYAFLNKIDGELFSSICGTIFFFAAVIATTYLLVSASAEALGSSPDAWLKAIMLELAILTTFNLKWKPLKAGLIRFFLGIGLISLSLSTLHLGVKSAKDHAAKTAYLTDETLTHLREERSAVRKALEAIPNSHVTKRIELANKLAENKKEFENKKAVFEKSASADLRENRYWLESSIRFALILINILFLKCMTLHNQRIKTWLHLRTIKKHFLHTREGI